MLTALLCPTKARGHAGERRVIELTNEKIKDNGETAELLIRRARSFRILGDVEEERSDLNRIMQLYPDFKPAKIAMAQVCLDRQDFDSALELATSLLEQSPDEKDTATLHVICGDAHLLAGRPSAADMSYEIALKSHPDEVDWHLKRSEALATLGRHGDRAIALQAARERLPSIVLELEWIDALIECNEANSVRAAITMIESNLEQFRLRSSWLLRRAEAYLALNQQQSARIDLAEALRELDSRIAKQHPDPALLLDRAYVLALRGEKWRAEQDLAAAKRHGAVGRRVQRVQRTVSNLSTMETDVD